MANEQVISTLNELIETCKDRENGFRAAAEHVKDEDVKALFRRYSQQRAQFAAELQALVDRLGGSPETTGSSAAALHRGWINLKSMAGMDDSAIIAEAERGEDSAVRTYEQALNSDLPSDVRSVVQRQYTEIKQAHDRVRDLEKAMAR